MLIDKNAAVAAIQSALDAVNALPDASGSDVQAQLDAALAQVADLQKKNDDAAAALAAEVALEADDVAKNAALQAKIDAAKAALEA